MQTRIKTGNSKNSQIGYR